MTPVFSGRPARGLENRVTAALHPYRAEAPDYPITYETGKALASAAAARNDQPTAQDYAALWAGQGFRSNRVMPAAELTARISAELAEVSTNLSHQGAQG